MKVCPTCGDVYPEQATECRAHGTGLREWCETGETFTGDHTDVDESRPGAPLPRADTDGEERTAPDFGRPAALSPSTGPTPRVQVAPEALTPTSPWEGRTLGDRYRLERKIGIGGYGAVFDAFDERLRKRVALKVLSPALSQDPEVLERFRREAIAASQVRHTGIVDVTDIDVDASGTHFIAMEYLDGVDLDEVLGAEQSIDVLRALDIAAQCADALASAHEAGILHRDLKPANIFLTRTERRDDVVKIIDFGISKITRQVEFCEDLTSASKVVGTPSYMSPEQARGGEIDGRADVYALGIIVYEMFTGTVPFKGKSALEILTNHTVARRVAPSEVNAALSPHPALDALVLRAIMAEPAQRYVSMKEFGDAIRECIGSLGEPSANARTSSRRATVPEKTVAVAPLPAPGSAVEPRASTSGEVTRIQRVGFGGVPKTLYGAAVLALIVIAASVLIMRDGSDWEPSADREQVPSRPGVRQTDADAGPAGSAGRAGDSKRGAADEAGIELAGEAASEEGAVEHPEARTHAKGRVGRQSSGSTGRGRTGGSRRPTREPEGTVGIKEW